MPNDHESYSLQPYAKDTHKMSAPKKEVDNKNQAIYYIWRQFEDGGGKVASWTLLYYQLLFTDKL